MQTSTDPKITHILRDLHHTIKPRPDTAFFALVFNISAQNEIRQSLGDARGRAASYRSFTPPIASYQQNREYTQPHLFTQHTTNRYIRITNQIHTRKTGDSAPKLRENLHVPIELSTIVKSPDSPFQRKHQSFQEDFISALTENFAFVTSSPASTLNEALPPTFL